VIEWMHWSRVLSPGDERASRTTQLGAKSYRPQVVGRHSATDARTVRIWPAIATPEMLCDKLTAT